MSYIEESINEAKSRVGCSVTKMDTSSADDLRRRFIKSYCDSNSSPLWERVKENTSVFDPNGWKKIANFPYCGKVIMLFDEETERGIFSFCNFNDIVKTLSESIGFVFYLTNSNLDFLICHNDHDYLIGSGIASDWIKKSPVKFRDRH
jgi:hypothetical protein